MTTDSLPQKPRAHVVIAVLGIVAVLGWGIVYVPSAWLMEQWPPLLAAGARVGIAGLVVLLVLALMRRPIAPGCSWWVIAALALTQSVILYGISYLGIKYDGAGLTSVLQNTDPLFVAILAVVVLGEVLNRGQWIGITIGLIGTIVVAWRGPLWPPEISWISVLVVLGAISWAIGTVVGARYIGAKANPVAIAGWQMLLGAPVLVVISFIFEHDLGTTGPTQLGLILFIALVGSALPFACFYIALTHGGASIVSAWFLLVPVVGVLTAWPALGEVPTPAIWVGTSLVCLGLWLVVSRASAGSVVMADVVPGGVQMVHGSTMGDARGDITAADRQWARALAHALEDRHVTPDEAAALAALADELGIPERRQAWIGGMFMADHVAHALEDGVVTDEEQRDLMLLAGLLGVDMAELDEMIDAGSAMRTGLADAVLEPGTRVHFSVPLITTIGGVPLTPARAAELAREHGLVVVGSAVRRCDVLVAADADVLGITARWRRRRGARLIVERSFWRSLGVAID